MQIEKVWGVWFSPTGSTEKLVRTAAQTLAGTLGLPVDYRSLNTPDDRQRPLSLGSRDFLVAGGPTYAGKLPNKIMPAYRALLHGENTPAVALVSFGNRSFDNALAELGAILTENGFGIVGAAACPAEHAMTARLAGGRPDAQELEQMAGFCAEIASAIKAAQMLPTPPQLPGAADAPYYRPLKADGSPADFLRAKPKTEPDRCSGCGLCASLCPMGSIRAEDCTTVEGVCIKCQACIRSCPSGAKYFDDPDYLSHVEMLSEHYRTPKKTVYFRADF